jgi:hypothetical protein
LRTRWGLTAEQLGQLRERLVAGGAAAAQSLVPQVALDDLIFEDPEPSVIGAQAADLGATSMAVPAFKIDEVASRVAWARQVLAVHA